MIRGQVGGIAISRASAPETSVNGERLHIRENMLQQCNAVLLPHFLYAITEAAFLRSLLRLLFIL
jgi:hypothetical protein